VDRLPGFIGCVCLTAFVPAGQATCRRTLEVVEELNNTKHLEKIHYFMYVVCLSTAGVQGFLCMLTRIRSIRIVKQ
jgi:hypothetical protein